MKTYILIVVAILFSDCILKIITLTFLPDPIQQKKSQIALDLVANLLLLFAGVLTVLGAP